MTADVPVWTEYNVPMTSMMLACFVCQQLVELYFNGGELDSRRCCGYVYSLTSPRVDLEVRKDRRR